MLFSLRHIRDKAQINFLIGLVVSLAISVPLLLNYMDLNIFIHTRCSLTLILFLLFVLLGAGFAFGGIGWISAGKTEHVEEVSLGLGVIAAAISTIAYMIPVVISQLILSFIALIFLHDQYVFGRYFDTDDFKMKICMPFTDSCIQLFGESMAGQVTGLLITCLGITFIFILINIIVAAVRVIKDIKPAKMSV
jgi:hypothetical protein